MTSKEAIQIAQREIGVKESPPNSNNVKYNTWFYGKPVNGSSYPWCCAFISWIFRGTNLFNKTASCMNLYTQFKNAGRIVKDPLPGDIVFFRFNTNNNFTNHVGIVEDSKLWPKSVTTIEGNTSVTSDDNGGAVMRRVRKGNIVAFARPRYSDAGQIVTPTTTVNVKNKPTLRYGDKGDWVKVAQARLFVNGHHIEVDGVFGANTKNAVIAFQASYGLTKDGIIGPKTWAKLYPS